MNKDMLALVGVLFAAIIGAFFSFVNLITSKEQKVSEFRQAWINALRDSVSNHIAALYYLNVLNNVYSEEKISTRNKSEITHKIQDIYVKINQTYNDIVFRVNQNETDVEARDININFLNALEAIRLLWNNNEYYKVKASCEELRKCTKPLLKKEWERVKKGEKSFRNSKRFAIVVLIGGFALLFFSLYRVWVN